ncbi:MAG: extracellular solute-binding protein [Oscillospiraceae bacterium]|nr:extracellular solute-binding protein [Oscillospiraceae bacterium]
MKKIINILAVCFIIVVIAGCNDKTPSSKVTSNISSENKDGIAATGSKYAQGITMSKLENKKIKIMVNQGMDFLKSMDSEDAPNTTLNTLNTWKATYGTDAELEVVNWDDFSTYLATAAAADMMPDVVIGGQVWFPSWPAKNLVQSLDEFDEYLDLDDPMWRKDIMDQFKWNDKHYVAYAQVPEHFYICYNKTKFELVGETTPLEHWKNKNWNWTQFVKTAKSMSDPDNDEYGYTGWNLAAGKAIYPMIKIDGKNITSNATSQEVVRWFTELNNLHKTGTIRTDNDRANFLQLFPAGKDAMISISPEEYIRMRLKLDITGGDEFELAPFPIFDPNGETMSKTTVNIYGLSITSKAQNPEGAAEYIRLNFKIINNIEDSFGELGRFGKLLNKDEKSAIIEANKTPVMANYLSGFGKAYLLFQDNVGETIYSPTKEGSIKSLLDAYDPLLKAEIKEFTDSLTAK